MGRKEGCRFCRGSNSFGEDELKKWLNSMWWFSWRSWAEKHVFLGEDQCPEIVVDSPLFMAYYLSPLKAQWMIWVQLSFHKWKVLSCDLFLLFYLTLSVFLFYLNCRCSCCQNPEDDLTKTQEKHSNQKESPEVNNIWSNKLSCSVAHFWFFLLLLIALESFSFLFKWWIL